MSDHRAADQSFVRETNIASILRYIHEQAPISRARLAALTGLNKSTVSSLVEELLERGLIEQVGRAEVVGRPMTYGTTAVFLEYFGLRSLDDLPAADELRRIPVTRPETLPTAEPGLATAPPEQLTLPEAQAPDAAEGAAPPQTVEREPGAGPVAGEDRPG